jgi:hypothetical protein
MSHKPSIPYVADILLAEAAWLVSAEGLLAVARSAELASNSLAANKLLRKDFSARQAQLILLQRELRLAARVKFPLADSMFFTRRSYEQATDAWIARYKAKHFRGLSAVADFCTGLGGDAMGLADVVSVKCVDRDAGLLQIAAHNVGLIRSDAAAFIAEDVSAKHLADCDAWHIDPDRRQGDKRTTNPFAYEPGVEFIDNLLERCPRGCLKLAPAAIVPEHWRDLAHLEWISRGRECRQLVAWFGEHPRKPEAKSATNVTSDGTNFTFFGEAGLPFQFAGELGPYLYEPDAAVLASDLAGAMARHHGLLALADGIHYFTGEVPLSEPLLTGYWVDEVLPLRLETVQKALRSRDVGTVEVKKRGVDIEPAQWQKALRGSGANMVVVFATRLQSRMVAIIAKRLETKPDGISVIE